MIPGSRDLLDHRLASSDILAGHPASAAWGVAIGRDLRLGHVLVPHGGSVADDRALAADLVGWTHSARAHRFALATLASRGLDWDPSTWRLKARRLSRREWQHLFWAERRGEAAASGYFWVPCPRCGDDFGGHERSRLDIPCADDPHRFMGACLACEEEVGAAARPVCAEIGHDPTTVGYSGDERHWDAGVERYVPFRRPSTEHYCARCFVTLSSVVAG